jgi:aminoglycoside phosphotransferase (APT) family kinase protein
MSNITVDYLVEDIEKNYAIQCSNLQDITGGWINRKWRAHSCCGDIVIKELSTQRNSPERLIEVEKALKMQSEIHKRHKIVPRLFAVDQKIIQRKNNFNYIIMEYVDGVHLNAETISDHELNQLGAALAQIHTVPVIEEYTNNSVVEDHFGNLMDYFKKTNLNQVIHNSNFSEIICLCNLIRETINLEFFTDLEIGFTHSDFAEDNILFNQKGVSVLDFDRARIAYPLQDVGRAIMSFTFDGSSISPSKLEQLIKGYNSIKAIESKDVCKALRLIWIIEVTWWFYENHFGEDTVKKVKEFRDEIVWITKNWEKLDCLTRL